MGDFRFDGVMTSGSDPDEDSGNSVLRVLSR